MLTSWTTYTGKLLPDIAAWVRANRGERTVHIGTDSMQHKYRTQFVTVVILYAHGHGGIVAIQRETVPRIGPLRQRLVKETLRSLTVGLELDPVVPAGELAIHIDANPDLKHRSSDYVQELVGMVLGQGFRALIKPEAWAASHAADHIVRTQGKLPRLASA